MNYVLPSHGQTTFEALVPFLRNAADLLGEPARILVKTVAYRTRDQGWVNYATLLTPCASAKLAQDEEDLEFEDAKLLSRVFETEEFTSADNLKRALTFSLHDLGIADQIRFPNAIHTTRVPSRDQLDTHPGWVIEIHGAGMQVNSPTVPRYPYLHVSRKIFAEHIGALTSLWLGDPNFQNDSTIYGIYRIKIPDRRARIARLLPDGSELEVEVDTLPTVTTLCGASILGFTGTRTRHTAEVVDGTARFSFPTSVKAIELWVLDEAGNWLDNYRETETYSSWGEFAYQAPRALVDESVADLEQALASGEGPNVEFKEWIAAAQRDSKSAELLKTCVAFANAGGGYLYIGVNDDGQPLGTIQHLKRAYGKECGGDLTSMQESYVRDLCKMLLEATAPQIRPEFDWMTLAQLLILRVRVAEGHEKPYFANESGDIYLRVGATSRKLRQADFGTFFPR